MIALAQDLIEAFGRRVGKPWVPTEGDIYTFFYEGRIEVSLKVGAAPNLLDIYAYLCPLPSKGSAAFYKKLLKAHFFGLDTAGAAFGISTTIEQVIFYRVVEAHTCDERQFALVLRDFVFAYDAWQKYIKEEFGLVQPVDSPFLPGGDRLALMSQER